MNPLILAWRQLRRDFASGDVRILFVALVLAVVAITAVGFVTDRAERALAQEANRLLGGDVALRGDTPIAGALREAANKPGLQHADTLEMRSMLRCSSANCAHSTAGTRCAASSASSIASAAPNAAYRAVPRAARHG